VPVENLVSEVNIVLLCQPLPEGSHDLLGVDDDSIHVEKDSLKGQEMRSNGVNRMAPIIAEDALSQRSRLVGAKHVPTDWLCPYLKTYDFNRAA
jgi:hypothetical protein